MTEHEEMVFTFSERVGPLSEYITQEEKNLWFSWLGVFTMGWDAHRTYMEMLERTEKFEEIT